MSEILSSRYTRLDLHSTPEHPETKKLRAAHWPDLEAALNEWQIRMVRKGATITGYILQEMASRLWDRLPQYSSSLERKPHFSAGWLTAFKSRHHISQKIRHGEAAGVNRMQLELDLADLRTYLETFPLDDIYNFDETGLFWKALPDRTLASEQLPGGKLAKERITVAFCCNASGNHKMDPWFIHKYRAPRCFQGINLKTLEMEWRANSKAWMTGKIFTEWLQWFNCQVSGRKVCLLIDGFSAHHTAIIFFVKKRLHSPTYKSDSFLRIQLRYVNHLIKGSSEHGKHITNSAGCGL